MENYSLIKKLGRGGFGDAHLAENKEDGKQVVVKDRIE